ncbi:hypothetical protein VPH35_041559 [Triticum aestivum]|uniref:uncharacterized protein isoform X2 n=1 Tax=Triticum aestivum TaxID=4565 RepID=UPI001D0266A7|nr:uncharacterized protein LOC123050818 isoform X2 [Triticum aestivum]
MESRKDQSDELSTLIQDIISLERERKDLLGSLTPTISRWEDILSGTTTWADNTMSVPVHKKNTDSPQVRDDEKELVDSILQDTEDLGHRLLSMSQYLWISHARISLYTADELVTTTSRLKKISKDFYKATEEAAEEKRKEDKERDREMMLTHEFLCLSSSVLARPNLYKNELAMMFTVEDEEEYERVMEAEREMERQRENCKRRRRKKRPPKKPPIVEVEHAADEQETKSQTDQLKEWMDDELEFFAGHRSTWERSSGDGAAASKIKPH